MPVGIDTGQSTCLPGLEQVPWLPVSLVNGSLWSDRKDKYDKYISVCVIIKEDFGGKVPGSLCNPQDTECKDQILTIQILQK